MKRKGSTVRIRGIIILAVIISLIASTQYALHVVLQTACQTTMSEHVSVSNLKDGPSNVATMVPPTKLALEQSFGFFDDINDETWKMYQTKARHLSNRNHATNPLLYWNNSTAARIWYSLNYEPLFTCPHVRRVGGVGDGPKWTCDPHRLKKKERKTASTGAAASSQLPCLVYSIGSNGDYSFEDSLVELLGAGVCEIHIFDPGNYSRPKNAERNIHYHSWGFKSSYDKSQPLMSGEFVSFPEVLNRLGHENRTIDILKVDCEFCEWYSYKDWINYGDIRQLMIETHRLPYFAPTQLWPNAGMDLKPTTFFDDLQAANYVLFSKEPNIQGEGDYIEWAYIKLHPDFLHGKD